MPLQIIRKNIVQMKVDAIVNPTNEEMIGYGGVDLAVHEAAGPELDDECARLAPLELGFAKLTPGYKLKCKYVIHTVGPWWNGGNNGEHAILKSCYEESLRIAKKHKCSTVAFPLIASGAYGYPKDQVLDHAIRIISDFLLENEMTVYLCVYDKTSYELSKRLTDDLKHFFDSPDCEVDVGACCSAENDTVEAVSCQSGGNWKLNKSFAESLFDLIDARKMTDVECYRKANIDRKTFSKIKCNPNYKPSKQTAVAFAIALELNLEETQDLLATAGMTLSKSLMFDMIIRYYITRQKYDIMEINEALFDNDQILLGC